MAANTGNANRQRMINLMYIVFIAMMALNVSSEVVEGFTKVEDGLKETMSSTEGQNAQLKQFMEQAYALNPTKAKQWHDRAQVLSQSADSLVQYIQLLKQEIAERTDGSGADPNALQRREYVGASAEVMLSPLTHAGRKLRERIEAFRALSMSLHPDSLEAVRLLSPLETTTPPGFGSWQEATFDNMPSIASITLLTKLQLDLRYTQGQVLSALIKGIDSGDIRVNSLTAQVIPESRMVMQGTPYRAHIVLSSIDTTQSPRIVVNDHELSAEQAGVFVAQTSKAGVFPIKGYIEAQTPSGAVERRTFESSYTVIEPMATVAPVMMNVLYAGIDNPLRIAVPGIAMQDITATASSGTLSRQGNLWVIRPTRAGTDITISVSARHASGSTSVGSTTLRVRALPDPTPYIQISDASGGATTRFKGGRISKQALLSAGGIKAAIDDSALDVAYTVLRFQLVSFDSMGNALPEVSNNSAFSERQLHQIRSATRGKRMYITEVIARGPDGVERRIPSIELILN